MSTTGTSCRKGTSTILGTLIFIGIIFTAFIPMMLVMKQADTIYEMRKHELGILEQERMNEDVHVYAFPATGSSPENPSLTLIVENRGNLAIKIVKIWINDDTHSLEDFVVEPMSWIPTDLDYYTFVPTINYFIKITTDRGNMFSSDSGSIFCKSDGSWDGGLFTINFLISYPEAGWFDVEVRYSNDNDEILLLVPDGEFSIQKSMFGSAFEFFNVPNAQKYHISITKRGGTEIYARFKTIEWPNGPPVVWVFA